MNLEMKEFNELTTEELYEILKARATIFVKEQNIRYIDMDDIDYRSIHCFYKEGNKVIAYMRAFDDTENKEILHLGRLLTINHGNGIGKQFFKECLVALKEKANYQKISIHAQKHAIGFYEQFGFKITSDEFLEEGVVHVTMAFELQ